MRRILTTVTLSVSAVALAALTPAAAHADDERVIALAHGAITATVVPVEPGVASAGDLRTYYVALTRPGKARRIGHMSGSLLTTAVDKPRTGWELRTADLVFTVGRQRNQLVIGGIARYRQQAPTVAEKESVVRPVVGGSGRFAGAHGWCESIHLADNSWRHVFHVDLNR